MIRMKTVALTSLMAVCSPVGGVALHAQSGDALAKPENTCLDHGLQPASPAFNICVDRAAAAYFQGAYRLADLEARSARGALKVCASYGIAPQSLNFRQCMNAEIDRRTAHSRPTTPWPGGTRAHSTSYTL